MLSKRNFLTALAAFTVGTLSYGRARAQAYPNRPIKIVIPFEVD